MQEGTRIPVDSLVVSKPVFHQEVDDNNCLIYDVAAGNIVCIISSFAFRCLLRVNTCNLQVFMCYYLRTLALTAYSQCSLLPDIRPSL